MIGLRALFHEWRRARTFDALGEGASFAGQPVVGNFGRIEIGRRFHLDSQPVVSHFECRGGHIVIGDDVRIGHGAALFSQAAVRIEDGARIGPFLMILDSSLHRAGDLFAPAIARPVRVGAHAVLEAHVTLLPGADVGDGARVLAGSVVTRPIPPGAVAAGVPATPLGSWTGWDHPSPARS